MRLRTTAALAASSALGAGVAAVAAGRYASGAVLRPPRARAARGPLPAGFEGPALTVHHAEPGAEEPGPDGAGPAGAGRVALTRSLATLLPGTYGLTGRRGLAVVGPVLDGAAAQNRTAGPSRWLPGSGADTVVRSLEPSGSGTLRTGDKVWLTPQVYAGGPREALGLPCDDVRIPGELGTLPAWFVPGERDTWVITVHGLGATREHPLAVFPFLATGLRLPVLGLAYRGDPGAPRPAGGVCRLGAAEWHDLDAAIRYAVRRGARRVVLHGWSSGATMALHAAAGSALRARIGGLVLDSPVLDWHATLRSLAAARGVPRALLPFAVRAAQGRTGLMADRLTAVADPRLLTVPALLVHGPADTVAPWDRSQEFAAARPDLVSVHTVDDAPHAAMWNADPQGYEEALRRFLTPLM